MPTNPWAKQTNTLVAQQQEDQDEDSFIRFEEAEVNAGDQAGGVPLRTNNFTQSTGMTSRNISNATSSTTQLNADQQRRKQLVERMEREGQNLQQFMDGLKRFVANGLIPLGTLLKQVETSYPSLNVTDRNHLVKECLKERTKVDWVLFEDTIVKFASAQLRPTVTQFFQNLASTLIEQMKSSPMDSFKQFLRANQLSESDVIGEVEFGQIFGKVVPQYQGILPQAFKSLNVDADGFVLIKDLLDVLLSYVSLSSSGGGKSSTTLLASDQLKKAIPGIDGMSPRTRSQNVVEWYKKELTAKNMKPISLFKLADPQNTGMVSLQNLDNATKKMFPTHKPETVSDLMSAFKGATGGIIKKDQFDLVFNGESGTNAQQSPEKAKPEPSQAVPLTKAQQAQEDAMKWVKKLDNALLKEGISPAVAFKHADQDNDGMVSKKELGDAIKRFVPDDQISLMDLLKVIQSFDTNRNGQVEEQEFIQTIQKARDTTVIVQGGQPSSSNGPKAPEDQNRKSMLPLKDSNAAIQASQIAQPNAGNKTGSSITLLINELEDKVNIKQLFSDVTINEDGKYQVVHLQRRFKQETALKPSDYLPIFKELDIQNTGQIEVKSVIKLLEKHSKVYARDFKLEIKYIANFLEFRLKNRSTRTFFETNSTLRSDVKLLEIDVLTQLNRCFDISVSIGPTIYRSMKDKSLQELCEMIDEHRIIKGESFNADPNKPAPETLLTALRVKLGALPKLIQTDISKKFKECEDPSTKSISFEQFFKILEEEQVVSGPDCRAIYKLIMGTGQVVTHQMLVSQNLIPALEPQKPAEKPSQKLPSSVQQDTQSSQQSTTAIDVNLLVSTLEKQLGIRLEVALEELLLTQDDVIVAFSIHNKLMSYNRNVEKRLLTALTQAISKNNNGKIEVREVVNFLAQTPNRYSQESVVTQMINEIVEPFEQTLKDCNFVPNETYSRSDYLSVVQIASSSVSVFHALCLFYDLAGGQEEMQGKALIGKLKISSIGKKPSAPVQQKPAFPQTDVKEVQSMSKNLVTMFSKINIDTNIASGAKKLSQILTSKFKTDKEALLFFDPSGKNSCFIDVFFKLLKSISADSLSQEELLAITFIPVDFAADDYTQISLKMYFFQAFTRKDVPVAQVNKYKNQLQATYDALVKLFPVVPQKQQPIEEVKAPSTLQRKQTALEESKAPINPSPVNSNQTAMNRMDTYVKTRMSKLESLVSQIKTLIVDRKKKEEIISLFANAEDQAIQSDVLMHLFERWGIQMSEEQMMDLEHELDPQSKGRFKLNELLNFCKLYEIDLKYDGFIRGGTVDEVREQYKGKGEVLTCGGLTYEVIPAEDYYKGCPTMLTSEEAALVVAHKIFKSIPDGGEYFDPDFGARFENDIEGTSKALYFGTQKRKNHPQEVEYPPQFPAPETFEWRRPEEFLPEGEEPIFLENGASSNDVMQGILGDCWFISALSVLATRDELVLSRINGLTPENIDKFKFTPESAIRFGKSIYPGIFHVYRAKGIYVFRFFKDFKWIYVIVDDRIPCVDGQPVFARCKELREVWVPLLEKAYAKLHGCYEALISGTIDEALAEMTGYVSEKIDLHSPQGTFPNKALGGEQKFWEYLTQRVKENCLMGCSKSSKSGEIVIEGKVIQDGFDTGIKFFHAYGVLKAFEIDDKQNPGQKIRIVRVRNPWGFGEWNGAWNDQSDEVQEYLEELTANMKNDDEPFDPTQDDGTFLISYEDFTSIFNNMYVCVDFPENWEGYRYRASWEKDCSGGIPEPISDENARKRWASNPQFCIENNHEKELELFISLAQPDGRGRQIQGNYIEYPYVEVLNQINFVVVHIPFEPGKKNGGPQKPPLLQAFDQKQVKKVSKLLLGKEVSARVTCPKGYIYIVPSTRSAGQVGPFILSIYFNQSKSKLHFSRLDKPKNDYQVIQEEAENPNNVQNWKISLSNNRLKYAIINTDIGEQKLQSLTKGVQLGQGKAKLGSGRPKAGSSSGGSNNKKKHGAKLSLGGNLKKNQQVLHLDEEECGEDHPLVTEESLPEEQNIAGGEEHV